MSSKSNFAITRRMALLGATALIALPGVGLAQAEPVDGGRLVLIARPEPATLGLGLNLQAPTIYVGGKIFESLLTYSNDLKPMPSLAKSWSISDDGLTYRFELQQNATWHDGTPFTSADVVFTADDMMRSSHPRWKLLAETYVERIEADGDFAVIFTLKEPFSAFIYAFELSSLPIMAKHVYEGTNYRTNPTNNAPIGTGPFQFVSWNRGQSIELERYEDYWDESDAHLDRMTFLVIPDAASRETAFEQQLVDVLRPGDVEGFVARRLSDTDGVVITTAGEEFYAPHAFIQMNLRKPPFNNLKIRQAVMHAVDRDFISNNIWFGMAAPATGPVSSRTAFYEPEVTAYPFNVEKARSLVAESGLSGDGLKVTLTPLPYGQQWDRTAEYIAQQLTQAGLDVSIQGVDVSGWAQALSTWEFDLALNYTYQYAHPALGVARHYLSSNIIQGTPAANNQGYSNPEVDRLFTEAASSVETEETQRLYSEVQKLLVDDVALGWIFEMRSPTIYRDTVNEVVTSAIGVMDTMKATWKAA